MGSNEKRKNTTVLAGGLYLFVKNGQPGILSKGEEFLGFFFSEIQSSFIFALSRFYFEYGKFTVLFTGIFTISNMRTEQCVSVTELAKNTSGIIRRAPEMGAQYVFVNNKPQAVILGMRQFEQMQKALVEF